MAEEKSKTENERSKNQDFKQWVQVYIVSLMPLVVIAGFWQIFEPPLEVLVLLLIVYLLVTLTLAYPLIRRE